MTTTAYSIEAISPPAKASSRIFHRPEYLLLITTVTIFVAEFLVMMVLHYLPSLTGVERAVTDAVFLSLTVFPSLYFFVLKPMKLHIAQRYSAEAEKDRLIKELKKALDEVKTLRGIVPICAWCKSVRDDEGYWQDVEVYMEAHTNAEFTHGICPDCVQKVEL